MMQNFLDIQDELLYYDTKNRITFTLDFVWKYKIWDAAVRKDEFFIINILGWIIGKLRKIIYNLNKFFINLILVESSVYEKR